MSTGNINVDLKIIDSYFKAAISVDCVIFGFDENELKVLLMRCNMEPYVGLWSLIGDMVHIDEGLNEAADRILQYRTGLENVYLDQVKTFGTINRHPLGRVISIAYYSLVKISDYKISTTSRYLEKEWQNIYNEAHWHSIDDITDLAFDHNEILEESLKSLRKHVREEPVGFNLLPEKFTLSQLQNLYERILGVELDKRNFRKKILNMKLLKDINQTQQNVAHRPAKLYCFDEERYQQLKDKGLIFDL